SVPASAQGASGAAGAAGPPPATNVSSNKRLQQTQAQVDEVVDIMRMNVDKVLERDQKLSELDNRADALQAGASQFETSAAKLKRKYWWKNCKVRHINHCWEWLHGRNCFHCLHLMGLCLQDGTSESSLLKFISPLEKAKKEDLAQLCSYQPTISVFLC
ncbi:hypothetical protein Nmel_011471, partial [Mimus melanotis]